MAVVGPLRLSEASAIPAWNRTSDTSHSDPRKVGMTSAKMGSKQGRPRKRAGGLWHQRPV